MISVNGYPIVYANYPAGETNLVFNSKVMSSLQKAKLNKAEDVVVRWNYHSDYEYIIVAFIAQKLDDMGLGCRKVLELPYLPHARMDRIEENYQFYGSKYFLTMIDALGFSNVFVKNIHSDKVVEELNMCRITNEKTIGDLTKSFLRNILKGDDKYVIVYPDKGAYDRFYTQLDPITDRVIICDKERDFATGKIKGITFSTSDSFPENTEDYNLVIVDDICSYGGTFNLALNEIAKYHKFKGAYLVVSHLEESVFKGELIKNPLLKGIYHENTMDWSIHEPNYIEVKNERN